MRNCGPRKFSRFHRTPVTMEEIEHIIEAPYRCPPHEHIWTLLGDTSNEFCSRCGITKSDAYDQLIREGYDHLTGTDRTLELTVLLSGVVGIVVVLLYWFGIIK